MSNTNNQIPAGWYPDPSGSPQSRWWDGMRWTEHYQPVGYAQPAPASAPASPYGGAAYAPDRPLLADGAPIYNVFIWLVVLLPLLTYIVMPFWNPFAGISQVHTARDLQTFANPFAFFGWAYFAIIIVSWISYALIVVFAWRDHRWLESVGVVRPFHWAWAFLGGIVYVIGRSIIVRRVAPGRGLAPIWVTIGVLAVGFVVSAVWTSFLVSGMMHIVPSPGTFGGASGA